MSRLTAVHLSELCFGKFGHLKDGSQSCLSQSDPQESRPGPHREAYSALPNFQL